MKKIEEKLVTKNKINKMNNKETKEDQHVPNQEQKQEQNQDKGLNRNTIDKYYTKKEIVDMCITDIKNKLQINKTDLVIEPSAGNGAFIEKIKEITDNYLFFDIEPENNNIQKQDYLKLEYKNFDKPVHIVGNPPFGRQSATAIQFIKYSCLYATSISFILPKSFKKDSLKKHFDLKFHLISELDLPTNSFLVNNVETDVPCVFQIWLKKDEPRKTELPNKPNNFKFVKKTDNPDISFRRVGVNAGGY